MVDSVSDEPVRAQRAPTSIIATVTAGKRAGVQFRIMNLSITGAKLEGPLALRLNDTIRIKLTVDTQPVELDAEVVRVNTADLLTDQIAARFLNPTSDAVATLQRIVHAALYAQTDETKQQQTERLAVIANDEKDKQPP